MQNIGPPSERQALKSRFPQHDTSYGIYSHKANISMHRQLCRLFTGELVLRDLKLYLKKGRQFAKTMGVKRPMHFLKIGHVWVRVR